MKSGKKKPHFFRRIMWLVSVFVTISTQAQVKIGNNPNTINSSSILELESTNQGFVPPRVTLTTTASASPLTSPIVGTVIYNTGGSLANGYYYWTGTTWLLLTTSQGVETITGDKTFSGRMIVPMGELNYYSATGSSISILAVSNGTSNMIEVNQGTLSANGYEFTSPSAGRLRYTGATTKMFHCAITISGGSITNGGTNFVFGLAVNGVVQPCRIIQRQTANTDIQSTAMHCMVMLSTNDYISLMIGNLSSANDFQIRTVNVFALGM